MLQRPTLIVLTLLALPLTARADLPAFPGAEGEGMFARGGRGGDVYHVTNLDDDRDGAIAGSFRHGIATADGPRTIVFDIGGTIDLAADMKIDKPFITLAGQTAPGGGITFKGRQVVIRDTHDVIVRYIRCRVGDIHAAPGEYEPDALWVSNSENVIIDHVSASWGIDECLSTTHNCHKVTVQWCIIGGALHESGHHKGNHGYGSLIVGRDFTYHHNLYINNTSRNPRPGPGRYSGIRLDFVNNVIYNPGDRFGYCSDEPLPMNYVGNYGIAGPNTTATNLFHGGGPTNAFYQHGNYLDLNRNGQVDGKDRGWDNFSGTYVRLDERLPLRQVRTQPAPEACEAVLAHAGASHVRDRIDEILIQQVREQTGSHIDSQNQLGGWPELDPGTPPVDTDRDGMPDEWEQTRGLDPRNPDDRNRIDDDGYTMLEHYLNGLVTAARQ